MTEITLDHIKNAMKSVLPFTEITPLIHSSTFSTMTGSDVYLKAENLQKTGSFKVRGALAAISKIPPEERDKGVVTYSVGNHGQAVAYAAKKFDISCTICMPSYSYLAKIETAKGYGAKVILVNGSVDDALEESIRLSKKNEKIFIHAYEDSNVICGNGTLGLEILENMADLDAIVAPVGGGGLLAGIAVACKSMKPKIKLFGVQVESLDAAACIFKGDPLPPGGCITVAEYLAVRNPGELAMSIISELVDDIVTVTDPQISKAMLLLHERAKLVAESSGAAALAALLEHKMNGLKNKKVAVIISGGNVTTNEIQRLLTSGMRAMGKIIDLSLLIPDRPGILAKVLSDVSKQGGSIIEMDVDENAPNMPVAKLLVKLRCETRDISHATELRRYLRAEGFELIRYTS